MKDIETFRGRFGRVILEVLRVSDPVEQSVLLVSEDYGRTLRAMFNGKRELVGSARSWDGGFDVDKLRKWANGPVPDNGVSTFVLE